MISTKKRPVPSSIPSTANVVGLPEHRNGFLQFSQRVDYGLFLLIELAQQNDHRPLSLRTVADQNTMSFYFLQKVAFELRKVGLIRSDRGKDGGYTLNRPVENITLKEIIETFEGPMVVMHCLTSGRLSSCARHSRCTMRHGMNTVNDAILTLFQQTTLHSLLHPTWKPTA